MAVLALVPTLLVLSACAACSAPLRLQVSQTMASCIRVMAAALIVSPCSARRGASALNCSRAQMSLSMVLELSCSGCTEAWGGVGSLVSVAALPPSSDVPVSRPRWCGAGSPIPESSLVGSTRTRSLATRRLAPLRAAMCSCTGACRYWYCRDGGPPPPIWREMSSRVCLAFSAVCTPWPIHHARKAVSALYPLSAVISASRSSS